MLMFAAALDLIVAYAQCDVVRRAIIEAVNFDLAAAAAAAVFENTNCMRTWT